MERKLDCARNIRDRGIAGACLCNSKRRVSKIRARRVSEIPDSLIVRELKIANIQRPPVVANILSGKRIEYTRRVGVRVITQEICVIEDVEEISAEFHAPILMAWNKPERLCDREV